jgi:hypothetical protein
MSEIVQGELSRHHNKPFYAQQQRPKLFWGGCLIPVALIALFGFFVVKGLTSSGGLEIVRGFILVVILFTFAQLIFGGTIFARTRSSLGKGLLLGACMLLLLLVLALVGLASALSNFIG